MLDLAPTNKRRGSEILERIVRQRMYEGQLPGAPMPERARPAVITLPASGNERGVGWVLLGYLRDDRNMPQWRVRNGIVGVVVGGETGVRSVYVRFDGPDGASDMQFVMLLEPRRIAPLSGWRSA